MDSGCGCQVAFCHLTFDPVSNRPLRSRCQGRQEDLLSSNQITAKLKGPNGSLRFDKTFDRAYNHIYSI